MQTIRIVFFLLTASLVTFSFTASADQPDGVYTLSGMPDNDVQLQCTCGGQNFIVPATINDKNALFSFNAIGTQIMANKQCPHSSASTAFYDLNQCQFQSTKGGSVPTVYATVVFTAIGLHCMASGEQAGSAPKCPAPGWATAANVDVQPTSSTADYMVTNGPTSSQPIRCTNFACEGKNCCNQWTGQLFQTIAGSVTITDGPSDLKASCALPSGETMQAHSDPQGLTIDLQTVHDQFMPDKQGQDVTAICQLSNTAGDDYGSIELHDIDGVRPSSLTPPAHIWSTDVSIYAQPKSGNYKLEPPQVSSGSDTSGNYHNLWTVDIQPGTWPGSIKVTGFPATTISGICIDGLVSHVITMNSKLGDGVIDLQTVHDQFAPGDPTKAVNPTCELHGSNGVDYGVLHLTGLQIYNSTLHPDSTVWAAQISIKTPPKTTCSLQNAPDKSSDYDNTRTYYSLWDAVLTCQ